MPCFEGSGQPSKNICEVIPCSSLLLALAFLKLSVYPNSPMAQAAPLRVAFSHPRPESLFCLYPVAFALPAHQRCTLFAGWLEGAGPELGFQVLGAVVLAVALQEVQGLQLQGRLWGQKAVIAAPVLAPSHTLPATLL